MKILVLGGTGAVGRYLLPLLIQQQHEIISIVRSPEKKRTVEKIGAQAVIADVLNTKELTSVILNIKPEIIINHLTSLASAKGNFRKFDNEFELTNRFRTEVNYTIMSAARLAGVKKIILQSFCGWTFSLKGNHLRTENDPLTSKAPTNFDKTLKAIKSLENLTQSADKVDVIVLRYGIFYGPGTSISKDGLIAIMLRKRFIPIVGSGNGIWSFIHIKDVALSTSIAINSGSNGIYNIVDDEPAPVSEWLPYLAKCVGAKTPRKIPRWLGRLLVGEGGVLMMTGIRGVSNAKAKAELGWEPTFPSWRKGFVEGLD